MDSRHTLIDQLRHRSGVSVEEDASAWLVHIPKGAERCEITIPKDVFEWFASVKDVEGKEVWSDWMDYYDASPEVLERQMKEDISSFIERVLRSDLKLPLCIWEAATEGNPGD
jgi:hypothetical protein